MLLMITAFAGLISLSGLALLIKPALLVNLLRNNANKPGLHLLAVIVRLLLGALLITHASAAKYPVAIEIIGWLLMVAAVVLAVIGRSNFMRFMAWALSLGDKYGRIAGLLAVAFGAYLIYVFI